MLTPTQIFKQQMARQCRIYLEDMNERCRVICNTIDHTQGKESKAMLSNELKELVEFRPVLKNILKQLEG